jgi:ribosome-binding factor A
VKKTPFRVERVGERIYSVLSGMLVTETRDPRLAGATIVEVVLSPDLSYATIHFSLLEESAEAQAQAVRAFKKAAGFFRSRLAKTLTLRQVPELRFRFDDSVSRGEYITRLIHQARENDEQESS